MNNISYKTLENALETLANGDTSIIILHQVVRVNPGYISITSTFGHELSKFEEGCSFHYTEAAEMWELKRKDAKYFLPLPVAVSNVLSNVFGLKSSGRKIDLKDYAKPFLTKVIKDKYDTYMSNIDNSISIAGLVSSNNENDLLQKLYKSSNWIDVSSLLIGTRLIHRIFEDMNIICPKRKRSGFLMWEPYNCTTHKNRNIELLKTNDYCITFIMHNYINQNKEYYNIDALYSIFSQGLTESTITSYFDIY